MEVTALVLAAAKEAKDLVEAPAPVVLAERWPRAQAESLAALLEEAGATVEPT